MDAVFKASNGLPPASMTERLVESMDLTKSQLHDVPSDPRGAGICAFTSRDIKKNEIICEYGREVVTEEEARAQEMLSHFPPPPLPTE
ncbi:hypothetical protein ACROYT_G015572 [Oculina patagonica]